LKSPLTIREGKTDDATVCFIQLTLVPPLQQFNATLCYNYGKDIPAEKSSPYTIDEVIINVRISLVLLVIAIRMDQTYFVELMLCG
jgi:hypothetical protein